MTTLGQRLSARVDKDAIVALLTRDASEFSAALSFALTDSQPQSWRSAWLLGHATEENDPRLRPHIEALTSAIEGKPDGHQRELIRLVAKMALTEDQEGELFDVCMTIWEDINKMPSVRAKAFGFIAEVAKKYPEMIEDIDYLTQSAYTHTLSRGVKHSIELIKKKFLGMPGP